MGSYRTQRIANIRTDLGGEVMVNCWASAYCKKYPSYCSEFCEGYVILQILYKQSNIPARYQYSQNLKICKEDSNAYTRVSNIMTDVKNWVERGNNLLLWSTTKGNGKTSLACAIANSYIRQVALTSLMEPMVYFIKSARFLEYIREQFNNPDASFKHTIELVERVPLLIIDDIGAEKPSDWVRERLLSIIDERYSNNRSIIYTSNCGISEITESLHARIGDRIRDAEQLNLIGQSRRGGNL